jgi:hypothetical protein
MCLLHVFSHPWSQFSIVTILVAKWGSSLTKWSGWFQLVTWPDLTWPDLTWPDIASTNKLIHATDMAAFCMHDHTNKTTKPNLFFLQVLLAFAYYYQKTRILCIRFIIEYSSFGDFWPLLGNNNNNNNNNNRSILMWGFLNDDNFGLCWNLEISYNRVIIYLEGFWFLLSRGFFEKLLYILGMVK